MLKKIALLLTTSLFIHSAFGAYLHLPKTFFPGRPSCIYSKKCPKNKPFLKVTFDKNHGKAENIQESEECLGCDYLGMCELYAGHEHDLEICQNRKLIRTTDEDDTLRLINILKECPSRTVKSGYECVSCTIRNCTLQTDECDKCPNRELIHRGGFRYDCRIKCPQNTFNAYDECISCDTDKAIAALYDEDCSCPNREYVNGNCVLKKETK